MIHPQSDFLRFFIPVFGFIRNFFYHADTFASHFTSPFFQFQYTGFSNSSTPGSANQPRSGVRPASSDAFIASNKSVHFGTTVTKESPAVEPSIKRVITESLPANTHLPELIQDEALLPCLQQSMTEQLVDMARLFTEDLPTLFKQPERPAMTAPHTAGDPEKALTNELLGELKAILPESLLR